MINGTHYPLFLKFGTRDHLEQLQQGTLYMKEAKFYRQLESTGSDYLLRAIREAKAPEISRIIDGEKISTIAGMADPYDSCRIQRNADIKINGMKVPRPDIMSITDTLDEKTPIFCCTCLKESDWTFDENEDYYRLSNQYLKDLDSMRASFGNYVLVIPFPEEFIRRIKDYCNFKNIDFRFKEVQYVDYKRQDNYWEKLYKNNLSHFFIKDQRFWKQREFRILLSNVYTNENEDFYLLNIPNGFSDFTGVIPVEKLGTVLRRDIQ